MASQTRERQSSTRRDSARQSPSLNTEFVTSLGADSSELSIYNSGQAVVRQNRLITLCEGRSTVLLQGMPEQYQIGTLNILSVAGTGDFKAGPITYRAANLDLFRIMAASCGRRVSVREAGAAGKPHRLAGKLLAVCGRDQVAVELQNGKVMVCSMSNVELEEGLPDGLSSTPSLTLIPSVSAGGAYDLELMYQCGGINWAPRFSAFYDEKHGILTRLECTVSITNHSGGRFENALVKLLAASNYEEGGGQQYGLESVAAPAPMRAALSGARKAVRFDSASSETVGETHVYLLPNPLTLENGDMQQCYLLKAENVPVNAVYILDSSGYNEADPANEAPKLPVMIRLKVDSSKNNKITCALPAGAVGIYQPDSVGSPQKIGNCNIGHVAHGESFNLDYGPVADIKAERVLLSAIDPMDENTVDPLQPTAEVSSAEATPAQPQQVKTFEELPVASGEIEASDEAEDTEGDEDEEPPHYRQEVRQLTIHNYKDRPVEVIVSEYIHEPKYLGGHIVEYSEQGAAGETTSLEAAMHATFAKGLGRTSTIPLTLKVAAKAKTVLTYTIRFKMN
jgi:hypothetical protein